MQSRSLAPNVEAAWRMCRLLLTKLSILAVTAALRQTACYLPLKFELCLQIN